LFAEQGYRLEVTPDRVRIEAATATGRFYAVQTLRQMMRAHRDGVLPCVSITDAPALEWRGVSDDISRGQVSTLADFQRIVRQLAYYKINLYQLYIEDMFRFEHSTTSGAARGALTRDELAQIVAEGRRYHVVVSPIFETLAHQDRFLSADDHRAFAEAPRTDAADAGPWAALQRAARAWFGQPPAPDAADASAPGAFAAGDPRTLRFVESLVDEIADVTRGPFFHIGGDEWQPPTPAFGASASVADDGPRAYGRYLGHVAAHVRERFGCRVLVYSDVILERPEAARDLSRDVVVVDWHYDPQDSFPSLGRLAQQGFRDVMVSPGLWTWRTFYPNWASALRNVATAADAGKRAGAMGCVAAAWEDDGAENLRDNNWAGYAFAAAASWEPVAPEADAFLGRFVTAQYGVDSPELARAEKLLGGQTFDAVGWNGRLYHRRLAVRARSPRWVARMEALRSDMRDVERDLDAAEPRVRFEREHVAAARHAAQRYAYIAERELALGDIGRRLGNGTAARLAPAPREQLAREIDALERTADALAAGYGPLWLQHNRPEGLAENIARMRRQGAMLHALAERARRGSLRVDRTYAGLQSMGGTAD